MSPDQDVSNTDILQRRFPILHLSPPFLKPSTQNEILNGSLSRYAAARFHFKSSSSHRPYRPKTFRRTPETKPFLDLQH